jgi:GGDEF domain-containing protein
MDKDDFENHTPIERLENFYKVLKHRRLTSTDSTVMVGDLEEFKAIINDIKESEVE